MPTNLLRRNDKPPRPASRRDTTPPATQRRIAVLKVRSLTLRIALATTATADRIWTQLPLNSTIETWGQSIHFETHVETGRDRTARLNIEPRDVAYWSEDDRIIVAWGPTPISRPSEIRMMRPCNVWATLLDDPSVLADITPGERVTLIREP